MENNPTSEGLHTGTAVVNDFSVINSAVGGLFKTYTKKKNDEALRREQAEAVRNKALGELKGDYGKYDTSKMRESDKEMAVKMNEEGRKEFEGHWGDVLNGDPYWGNKYRETMQAQKIFISNSVESKGEMKTLYSAIIAPDSGYSPKKVQQMEDYMLATGSTVDDMKKRGLYAPDTIVGDPLSRVDDAFKANGDELYKIESKSYQGADGMFSAGDTKKWLTDKEALPKFKATVGANPRLMSDMEIKYPGVPVEEQFQMFYDEYKASRETVKDDRDFKAAKKDNSTSSDDGGKSSKYDFAVRSRKENAVGAKRGEKVDIDVITIGKKSGSALTPITVNGRTGVVSEIRKHKNGRWYVTRNITKTDLGTITQTGETITEPVGNTMAAHLESEYDITDIEAFSKELKGGKSSSGQTAEDLINKYK